MTAGELALVVGAVLCALAFAALAVTLVRVRDTLADLRDDVAAMRRETAELRASTDDAKAAMSTARADLDRFDRVLGSAEAISGAVDRSNRIARTAFSTPMIKAAGIATGTSRAVKRMRRGVHRAADAAKEGVTAGRRRERELKAERDGLLVRLSDHLGDGDELLVDGELVESGRVILMRQRDPKR